MEGRRSRNRFGTCLFRAIKRIPEAFAWSCLRRGLGLSLRLPLYKKIKSCYDDIRIYMRKI